MKSTACIKKDVKPVVHYIKRKVTELSSIKINNSYYSHESLRNHLGDDVLVINNRDNLRIYDTRRRFICTAEKSLDLPKQEQKKKDSNKKPHTMEIHESLERIRENELCDMTLFELSIRALMPDDVYKELKKRLELIQGLLKIDAPKTALNAVNKLLASPQERLKASQKKQPKKSGGKKL
jgi:hypothetical protein